MIDEETVQMPWGDLMVALTASELTPGANQRELHILIAYILSELFGSAPLSRSWH